MLQDEVAVTCPYCWEQITVLVDLTAGEQTYTEDCFVCCRPIVLRQDAAGGLTALSEDEAAGG